ncbi:Uu.00g099450.m01.CDS01 [Anthostomella pinea]|uniref:Uu.00g099450.m01.CDS01 n=1 Tax=Anthostomella pinea TaxID=933095 RepID=A0AAI8VCW2_9PEZI|nr:Uu.00g099450.m01.CDS01 [Anthostomella pinea]
MVALACAANGANMMVRCMKGESEPTIIAKPADSSRAVGGIFVCTLWLVEPPPSISQTLRSFQTREDLESLPDLTGPVPLFGGQIEIAKSVSAQLGVDWDGEYQVALREAALRSGHSCACVPKVLAEIMVSQGLSSNRVLLTAARIWRGLPPNFTPHIPSDNNLVGIVCPQVTILLNVLFEPTNVAQHGLKGGLFSLYRGSIPIIPRDQLSGFVFAGEPTFRKPIRDLDALQQIPQEDDLKEHLIFTMEPEKTEAGVTAAIICGWIYGDPMFEINPFNLLAGLVSERHLEYMSSTTGTLVKEVDVRHMGSRELLSCTGGFKVRNGNIIVRAGSRTDLQVLAAGCHFGLRIVMVVDEKDAALIRNVQTPAEPGEDDRAEWNA